MMSSTLNLKTYLTTYLKTKEDKAKNDEEEKQIFSCEIVNSELENGFVTFITSKWPFLLNES